MIRALKPLRQGTSGSPTRCDLRRLTQLSPRPQPLQQQQHLDTVTLLSQYFSPTLKATKDSANDALSLLQRGGYIRSTASGLFTLLPSGVRLQRNLTRIIARHMRNLGASQLQMPTLLPAADWLKSGRWKAMGSELYRVKDRAGKDLLLAPTHEEEVTRLVGELVMSAKKLPVKVFQITRKHRDEPRARGGLIRTKEFLMKDMYTFDVDEDAAAGTYEQARWAYAAAFDEILGTGTWRAAEADTGAMGGKRSHEYHVEDPSGEDTIISCSACSYAANQELASSLPAKQEQDLPTKMPHPDLPTLKRHVRVHLFGPPARELVALTDDAPGANQDHQGPTLRAICLPTSRSLNMVKAARATGVSDLREITGEGDGWDFVARPEGPLGCYSNLEIVLDDECGELSYTEALELVGEATTRYGYSASASPGSNEAPFSLLAEKYWPLEPEGEAPIVYSYADVRNASDGDVCASCGTGHLRATRAVEVGHTFILGTRYSNALGLGFASAAQSEKQPFHMGCYGIGVTRLLGILASRAAASAVATGGTGFRWPPHLAPFKALVLPANVKMETFQAAKQVAMALKGNISLSAVLGEGTNTTDYPLRSMLDKLEEGDVALDDRSSMRVGEKLAEADLMGYPLVFVLGKRWETTGEVEIKVKRPGLEDSTFFLPLQKLTNAEA